MKIFKYISVKILSRKYGIVNQIISVTSELLNIGNLASILSEKDSSFVWILSTYLL